MIAKRYLFSFILLVLTTTFIVDCHYIHNQEKVQKTFGANTVIPGITTGGSNRAPVFESNNNLATWEMADAIAK